MYTIESAGPALTGGELALLGLVPVLTGLQFQGDVAVKPGTGMRRGTRGPVPAEGVVVVRGEVGRNTHRLLAAGPCTWARNPLAGRVADDLVIGALHVPPGATAYLHHPEHGYLGIGPGDYAVRRQRQYVAPALVVYVED